MKGSHGTGRARFWTRALGYRPSASMIVALIALFVALGGTTYAVRISSLPKRSVGPAQIRSKAVRTRHIKARNISRTKIARNAINSSLVAPNSLRGSDILESSLSTVPSATTADDAKTVGGRTVQKFSFNASAGTAATKVLELGGLTLTATCATGPALSVDATTSADGALIHAGGNTSGSPAAWYQADDDFMTSETLSVLPASGTHTSGTLTFAGSDGQVLTATFLAEETSTGCVFAGNATG
jgi:hypothetical protein